MAMWKRALVVAAGLAGSLVWVAAQTGSPSTRTISAGW